MLEVIIIGLVLSIDSFSAAIAMGNRPFSQNDALYFALSSGIAEGVVALFGALAGGQIISRFESIDHWVAFFLLLAVALHMAYESIRELMSKEIKEEALKFHSFKKILLVSLATSLDAFGVGVGLGFSTESLPPYIISIVFWAFSATLLGLYFAKKLSRKLGPIMGLVGSVILGFMSIQMLKI